MHALAYIRGLPPRIPTLAKFAFPRASHPVQVLQSLEPKTSVTVNGHLHRKPRIMGARSFAELRGPCGNTIQLLMAPETTPEALFSLLKGCGTEDAVSVTGILQKKVTREGETPAMELVVKEFQVLNLSNLDAARLDKLKHSNPGDIPPQFRYLQLRTPSFQNLLRVRSQAAHLVRRVLVEKHDFTEIETPLLFKSTPEGAREFLVPTRTPARFYALPQSPQQYKQMLMSSGFDRYFQLARCFRDEDLRADRQPEFTQVDLEMAYISNSDQVACVVEDVIHNVWNKVAMRPTFRLNEKDQLEKVEYNEQTDVHFSKLRYTDALKKYGIDKPDLRSALQFLDLLRHFVSTKNSGFPVVEACVLRLAFDPEKPYKVPHALTDANNYNGRRPIVLAIKTEREATDWYHKFVEKGVIKTTEPFNDDAIGRSLDLKPGDVLAFSTRAELPYENPTPLGKFRQLAISQFPGRWNRPLLENGQLTTSYDASDIFVGAWVVDFPLFSPIEKEGDGEYPAYDWNRFTSTHHPFTMAKLEDYDLLETAPLKVRGEHYDLVINGVEVGGGSRRIHDPELQQFVFEKVLKIENHKALFGHLLNALSMGCPPHAGIALGFDRLCAMLVGSSSIRDVIAFPKNQSGVDPAVESPTDVLERILAEYYVRKIEKKEGA